MTAVVTFLTKHEPEKHMIYFDAQKINHFTKNNSDNEILKPLIFDTNDLGGSKFI